VSRLNLAMGGLTVLIALAIFSYAVLRTQTASGSPSALTNPNDLNPQANLLAAGTWAPNFTLRDLSGNRYTLAAERGHPVLLEFFAVWCPVCQGEAPIMAHLTKSYAPKGVTVWSVLANPYGKNYDLSGRTDLRLADKSDLSWFAGTFNVQHPQLIDPTFKVVNEYGVNAYPGLYIVGANGRITYATSGHTSYATLSHALNRALKGA
jgi:peroxiredoxin